MDELIIYVAPAMLGSDARPLASILPISGMENRLALEFDDVRMVGNDIRLRLRLSEKSASAAHG